MQSLYYFNSDHTPLTTNEVTSLSSLWVGANGPDSIKISRLKVGFLNAISLKKHMWQFRNFLMNNKRMNNSFHVFDIAETRLGHEVSVNIVKIPGYSVLRQDRNINGGGILLYIKEHLNAKILCTSRTEQRGKPLKPEYLFCSVWEGNYTPTLIALVYRSPDVSIRSDGEFIRLLCSHCSNSSCKIVIDNWNADILNSRDSDTRFLLTLTNNLSLKLVNTGPSYHSFETNSYWIDSIFVGNCDTILSSWLDGFFNFWG